MSSEEDSPWPAAEDVYSILVRAYRRATTRAYALRDVCKRLQILLEQTWRHGHDIAEALQDFGRTRYVASLTRCGVFTDAERATYVMFYERYLKPS